MFIYRMSYKNKNLLKMLKKNSIKRKQNNNNNNNIQNIFFELVTQYLHNNAYYHC